MILIVQQLTLIYSHCFTLWSPFLIVIYLLWCLYVMISCQEYTQTMQNTIAYICVLWNHWTRVWHGSTRFNGLSSKNKIVIIATMVMYAGFYLFCRQLYGHDAISELFLTLKWNSLFGRKAGFLFILKLGSYRLPVDTRSQKLDFA